MVFSSFLVFFYFIAPCKFKNVFQTTSVNLASVTKDFLEVCIISSKLFHRSSLKPVFNIIVKKNFKKPSAIVQKVPV